MKREKHHANSTIAKIKNKSINEIGQINVSFNSENILTDKELIVS